MSNPALDGITAERRLALASKYAGAACVLDGKPAKIIGRLLPFAWVAQTDSVFQAEFSWLTVDRIMQDNGEFRS